MAAYMKKITSAISINCQLLSPKYSSRSEYVNCPILFQLLINININITTFNSHHDLPYLNNIINTSFKQEIVISMKQQSMPQIPQQNHAQTHSMYEQLRNTSERWFSGSHRRIFGNSNYTRSKQPSNQSSKLFERSRSKRQDLELPDDSSQKMRIILLMKEQIEISCQQYANRMKTVFQDQAKKIKLLGDLLLKNQMQLNKKQKIIIGLVNFIQNQAKGSDSKKYQQLVSSLEQKQDNITDLTEKIDKLTKGQNTLLSKISSLEKSYSKKLQNYTNNLSEKFNNYYDECEQRLDKFQKVLQMNSNDKKITKRGSINQNTTLNNIIKNIASFSNQIQEFREQIAAFKAKKYKYENYKLEQVQSLIKKIINTQNKLQNASLQRQPSSGCLKSTSTTKFSRTDSHFQTKYSQTSKTRFLNKYKSLINHRLQKKPSSAQNSQSEDQSQVQQTLVQQQTNIQRLSKIICQMRLQIPLKLEIDQTGYAKSMDTGMYLVDSQGNGFEFSKEELMFLTQNNTIELQY